MNATIQEQRLAVIREARALVDTPFHHLGTTAGGLDCRGLLVLARRRAGLPDLALPAYSFGIAGEDMAALLEEHLLRLACPGCAVAGDVLWWRVPKAPDPCHLLLLTERGTVIHAAPKAGVVEHGLTPSIATRVDSAWRFPEWAAS